MYCHLSMAMVVILNAITITLVVCKPGPILQRILKPKIYFFDIDIKIC